MEWIFASASHVLVALGSIWAILGVLAWSWLNYCLYVQDPKNGSDPVRWRVLFIAILVGPIFPVLLMPERGFYRSEDDGRFLIGLRFR